MTTLCNIYTTLPTPHKTLIIIYTTKKIMHASYMNDKIPKNIKYFFTSSLFAIRYKMIAHIIMFQTRGAETFVHYDASSKIVC